jgi:hypothetical protein
MTANLSQRIVVCEGYYDRAFWSGLLLHLGCTDAREMPSGRTVPGPIRDPWGQPVVGGQFAFYSATDAFIRVVPAGGKQKVKPSAETYLRQRLNEPLR